MGKVEDVKVHVTKMHDDVKGRVVEMRRGVEGKVTKIQDDMKVMKGRVVEMRKGVEGKVTEVRHAIAHKVRTHHEAHPWQFYLTVGSFVSFVAAVCVIMVGYQNEEMKEILSMCRGVGLQPLIDVTIPYEATFSEVMAVFYSFVPWAVSFVIVGCALVKRTTRWLASMAYILLVILCNEVFVKRSFPQKRPLASCLVSPGMPSSHSVISIGLLVWFLLERVELKHGMSFSNPWKGLAALLVLAPVPPSRVVLNDHSLEQVTAGSLLGLGTAMAFFNLMRNRVAPSLNTWCEHPYAVRFGVTNDYTDDCCHCCAPRSSMRLDGCRLE